MNNSCQLPTANNAARPTGSLVATSLVDALVNRDFAKMVDCFEPDATMRALLPRGPAQYQGAAQIVEAFRFWFGGARGFEVVDTTVEEVGSRVHLSWQLQVDQTPRGATGWHVIEQHVYVSAGERVSSLDLLCTGFMPNQPQLDTAATVKTL
jgi:hypothetical protein